MTLATANVLGPYQANHLYAPLLKLFLHLCESPKLRCAYWREICGMGEKDAPFVSQPFVEVNVALSCLCSEIWSHAAKA